MDKIKYKVRDWILEQPQKGKITFSMDEVHSKFPSFNRNTFASAIRRLVEGRKIQSVWHGFYVVLKHTVSNKYINYMKIINILFLLLSFQFVCAQETPTPPGTVINHFPGNGGKYIGSPSICILPNGDYVASHDEFGPNSTEFRSAVTRIFTSSDKGVSWTEIAVIQGLFWSNLFTHNDVL